MVDRVKSFPYINPYTGEFLSGSQSNLSVISRASHLCDQGSTLAPGGMWAEFQLCQLISIWFRGFFLLVLQFSSLIKIDSQSITFGKPSIGITSGILPFH